MTPDEDVRIKKEQKGSERLSWLLAVLIGSLVVLAIALSQLAVDVRVVIYPIVVVALSLSSFLVGRIYRKHMEQKLGRRLKSEYELTSLTYLDGGVKER